MNNFFKNINTLEELKKAYRSLIFELHPDKGGSTKDFQAMKNEYDILFKKLQFASANKNEKSENVNTFKNIMDELVKYPNLTIDVIGSWIWLNGETYAIKDTIKAMGFMWSSNRKKWFFNGETKKTKVYTKKTYQDLKNTYGCKSFRTKENELNQLH